MLPALDCFVGCDSLSLARRSPRPTTCQLTEHPAHRKRVVLTDANLRLLHHPVPLLDIAPDRAAETLGWPPYRIDALKRKSPGTLDQLVPLAYDDVSEKLHPVARRSLHAHLIKLAREGRVRESGESWYVE